MGILIIFQCKDGGHLPDGASVSGLAHPCVDRQAYPMQPRPHIVIVDRFALDR